MMDCTYEAHTANEELRVLAENAKLKRTMKEMEREHAEEVETLRQKLDLYMRYAEDRAKVADQMFKRVMALHSENNKLADMLVAAENRATRAHMDYLDVLGNYGRR